jgi:hypothetical protein
LDRLAFELRREQENLEAIQLRSLSLAEGDPDAAAAREIDEDWIFRFARFAQEISDKNVQELWAKVLSAAAVEGRQLLSAPALQTLSLLDSRAALDFRNFCRVITAFSSYPSHAKSFQNELQNINLINLKEAGLVAENMVGDPSRFEDFELFVGPTNNIGLKLFHGSFILTQRGAEIANAVFRNEVLTLPQDLEQKYLQALIAAQVIANHMVRIIPPPKEGEIMSPYVVLIAHSSSAGPVNADLSIIDGQLSERLRQLLKWVSENYSISLRNNIPSGIGSTPSII